MKRFGTLALIIILSAMPVLAQEGSTPAPAGDATAATTTTAAPAAAPAAEAAPAAPAADVDRSKLTPDMQGFMTKIDELRARRAARESETSGRVLPPGEPIDSGKWHKQQGHKRVFGWPSSGRRHRKAKADAAAATTTEEKKEEPKAEEKKEEPKAEEKKDEKKDK